MILDTLHPRDTEGMPTVSSVIDVYLDHAARRLSARTLEECRRLMQLFRLKFGHQPVGVCRPYYLQAWIDENCQWQSD